jgi:hypothetical protein
MAAGCLPVVHASRGPLEVIVKNGKYGLVYRYATELPELVDYAFNSARDFQHNLRNRALDFDIVYFKKKFKTIIDKTIDNNNSRNEL